MINDLEGKDAKDLQRVLNDVFKTVKLLFGAIV